MTMHDVDRASTTVVQLTTVHPWDDVRVYHKVCLSLAECGWNVVLVATAGDGASEADVPVVEIAPSLGRLRRLGRLFGPQRAAWREIRRLNPALVHLHDPELLPLALLLKRRGHVVVYDAHEDIEKQIHAKDWIPGLLRRPMARTVGFVVRWIGRRLDHVFTATESIQDTFGTQTASVLHNYPSLREFSAPSAQRQPDLIVTYVGGLTEVRGVRDMIMAMDLVTNPDVRLVLAGRFSSPELEAGLRQLPGWDRTESVGWIGRSEITELLGRSMAGVVVLHPTPNHLESLPIKMFEYFAAGIPAIVSDFPHFRTLAGDNAVIVPAQDPQALADAIDWVVTHPDEVGAMGEAARERVVGELNWEAEAQRVDAVYLELLAN